MSDLDLRPEPYDGPASAALIEELQAEYVERYGAPDEAAVDPAEFAPPAGLFLVGYLGGAPAASGGFRVVAPGLAEIKRMFVVRSLRGRGLSRVLLAAIEAAARDAGCARVRLVTGVKQPEAIALYQSSGYAPAEPFGHYADAPDARFFGKDLAG